MDSLEAIIQAQHVIQRHPEYTDREVALEAGLPWPESAALIASARHGLEASGTAPDG